MAGSSATGEGDKVRISSCLALCREQRRREQRFRALPLLRCGVHFRLLALLTLTLRPPIQLDFVKQTPLVCPGHSRGVVELNYSPETPDGVFLLSACQDKLPMLRSAATGDWIGTFEGHKGAVWNAHLDPTAHRAATASADFTARVWDAITGDELYQFEHPSVVKAARLSRNAQTLLTGGYDKKLRLYDLQKPEAAPTVLEGHTGRVSKAVFLGAQESTILSVGDDETCIKVWDRRTGAVAQSLATGENATDVEISEDGATLTVSAKDSVQVKNTQEDPCCCEILKSYLLLILKCCSSGTPRR